MFEKRRPKVSEATALGDPETFSRLITVCAWCKRTQSADGFWRYAEKTSRTDIEPKLTHGICSECAASSYNEYRLATFAARAA